MERRLQYGIFLLLILATGLSVYGFFFHSTPGSRKLSKADAHFGAVDLATAFEQHEHLSDSLYLFKVLSVSGIVKKIRKTVSGDYTIVLGDRYAEMPVISCMLDSIYNRRHLTLLSGDSLTIWGTCAGHLTDVILVQCIIENK
jgi:tRNA_anti-like